MESILEQQRRYHEERERLMDAMVREMLHKKGGQREQINSDHRLRTLLDRFVESTTNLKELYEDKDSLRKEEVGSMSGPNEFTEFYARLKSIKEFYRRHPDEISVPMSVEFEEIAKLRENPAEDTNMTDFTDEEGYGKYLDLHECYEKFINLKGIEKVDYITYLTTFDQLYDIPKDRKNADYRKYILDLLDYMHSYVERVKPLLDVQAEMENVMRDFHRQWDAGTFPGWPKETGSVLTNQGAHLDLSAFSSWEELASLGLDRLKSALLALGLKCGGTLEERAQRLFSTKGKAEIDPALLAKSKPGRGRETMKHKDVAALEAQVSTDHFHCFLFSIVCLHSCALNRKEKLNPILSVCCRFTDLQSSSLNRGMQLKRMFRENKHVQREKEMILMLKLVLQILRRKMIQKSHTILKICLLVGMANLSHIGFINFMGLTLVTTARYVATSPIKDPKLSKGILQNGDMLMV